MKLFFNTLKVMSFLAAIVALASYLDTYIQLGVGGVLGKVLEGYRRWLEFFLGPIEPFLRDLLRTIANRLNVQLQLYPHWKELFVPIALYFGRDISTNLSLRRTSFAIVLAFFYLAIAVAVTLAAATFSAADPAVIVILFFGFVLGSLANAFWNATLLPVAGQNWTRTFWWHFKTRILVSILLGGAVLFFGAWTIRQGVVGAHVFLLVALLILIALRDILVGLWVAMFRPLPPGMTYQTRLTGLGSFQLGIAVLIVVVGAVVGLMLG